MNVIEKRLVESRSMMLQIVNLFQSIVWIGGCESIDKSARIKFGKAQELANEIYLEFDGKVNDLCQTHADTKGEGDGGKQRNCDVYKTKGEAEKAFLSEPCDEPCGNCTIKDINNECGVKWLFAEHKGKAKK